MAGRAIAPRFDALGYGLSELRTWMPARSAATGTVSFCTSWMVMKSAARL